MKKLSLLLFALLLTTIIWGQTPNKMSYQAVIRDSNEALVSNQTIGMQISILQGSITGTTIYEETHTPTSNINGLISLEIGSGIIQSGDFSAINWSDDIYFVKTETDLTGGTNYTITGTSQLLSVPYAMHAKTAENISGLEKITEGSFSGWRLIGQDPANYGNTGLNAVTLSFNGTPSTTKGATGYLATTMGNSSTASGWISTAMGGGTRAEGSRATAMGYSTIASGDNSTTMGSSSSALGYATTAMGKNTTAESYVQTTLGSYNTTVAGDAVTLVPTDRLFVIGNGVDNTNRSDALTVLKNGTITAPSLDIFEITDDKSLITKEYFDTNTIASIPPTGLEQITENGNTGWRLIGTDPTHYGDIGDNAIDLTYSETPATNGGATGSNSVAIGVFAKASGDQSIAVGRNATASGERATAIGYYAKALGGGSAAIGSWVSANSYKQTTLGTYNTHTTGDTNTFTPTDRLFVIGNGTANNAKSDALVMLKNGNTTINGDLKVNEVNAPDSGNADMKAYIYGLTGGSSTDNTSVASSDGFTYVWVNTGHYRIYFNVPMSRTKYIAVATLHDGIGFINLIRQHNYIDVKTYNTSGSLSNRSFYFVVYKK